MSGPKSDYWNVVVSVRPEGFRKAFEVLAGFGPVFKTGFFNVLVVEAKDIPSMLETLRERSAGDPDYLSFLSRLVPVTVSFHFSSAEEFRTEAREKVLALSPSLAGKNFHARIYRRGLKGEFSSPEEERFLDGAILAALEQAGTPGRITFNDSDAIIAIETIGRRAGLSLWTREELLRYPFIRLD